MLHTTCQDPVLQEENDFKLIFLSPNDGVNLTAQSISLEISITNPENINNLKLDVNGTLWRNLIPKNNINLIYFPPNGLIESEYIFKNHVSN